MKILIYKDGRIIKGVQSNIEIKKGDIVTFYRDEQKVRYSVIRIEHIFKDGNFSSLGVHIKTEHDNPCSAMDTWHENYG